mmetsp:Transcript_8589/g.11335  ORF Transcript_8589/g.11335 Transcript_8589/m.11335 type:complete len:118 (+) Transcript_8589:2421-2774(+)
MQNKLESQNINIYEGSESSKAKSCPLHPGIYSPSLPMNIPKSKYSKEIETERFVELLCHRSLVNMNKRLQSAGFRPSCHSFPGSRNHEHVTHTAPVDQIPELQIYRIENTVHDPPAK